MRIFVCTDHMGHYPVGVASIVLAPSKAEANQLLAAELSKQGLDGPFTLQEIHSDIPKALVLLDGNY